MDNVSWMYLGSLIRGGSHLLVPLFASHVSLERRPSPLQIACDQHQATVDSLSESDHRWRCCAGPVLLQLTWLLLPGEGWSWTSHH